ncbi:GerMN domain-containing protein [Treponema phagedenis]|uniref:GerMN domain-containing protein n=1 Tax=Treponema phagedenis TaxID=162 RepID=UPI001FD05D56|nr:GerMN domain-containing protein [Treponema phagedenis]
MKAYDTGMAKQRKNRASLGCLFWIALILLFIVLFFLNKDNIAAVLEKTQAKDILFSKNQKTEKEKEASDSLPEISIQEEKEEAKGDGSQEPEEPKPAVREPQVKEPEKQDTKPDQKEVKNQPAKSAQKTDTKNIKKETPSQEQKKPSSTVSKPEQTQKRQMPAKPEQKPKTAAQVQKPQPEKRTTTIFWVYIDSDGKITRQETTRELPKSDSPMSDALNALFQGPNASERSKNYRSLIPAGTKLRSAYVKDGVATISVSEEFQFNQYGIEGYLAQLSQVVFTATAFSTVNSVQFLIEGQKKDYLGAEGVWIAAPLSRSSF